MDPSQMTDAQLRALQSYHRGGRDLSRLSTDELEEIQGIVGGFQAQEPSFGESLLQSAGELAGGFNRGVMGLLDMPTQLATIPMRMAGLDVEQRPFTRFAELTGAAPTEEEMTTVQRGAETMAGGVIPAAGMEIAAARTARTVAGPAIRAIQRNLGGFRAAEGASTAGATAGAMIGQEVAGPEGAAVGGLTGAFTPAGVGAVVRGATRGPTPNRLNTAIEQAGRAGVDLTAGQAGAPTAAAIEQTMGRLPGAQGLRVAQARRTADQLQRGLNRLTTAERRAAPEVGGRIERAIEGPKGFVERWRARTKAAYDDLDDLVGGDRPVTASNTARAFDELTSSIQGLERSGRRTVNPFIRDFAQDFSDDLAAAQGGRVPYEGLKRIRTRIGEMMDAPQAIEGGPQGQFSIQLRRLYASLTDDMRAAAEEAGPDAINAFNRANREYQRGATFIDEQLRPIMNKNYPEQIFRALQTGIKQGSGMVRDIKRATTPEQFDYIRSQIISRLGDATPGAQSAAGDRFSVDTFLTNWNRIEPSAKNALFGGEQAVLRRGLDDLAATAERVKDANRVLANPSGTSGALTNIAAAAGLTGGAGYSAASGSIQPLLASMAALAGTSAAGSGATALMQSPAFVSWLAQSTRAPIAQLPARIAELTRVAEQDPDLASLVEQYSDKLRAAYEQVAPPQAQEQPPVLTGVRANRLTLPATPSPAR